MNNYVHMTPEFFNPLPQYKRELMTIETAFDVAFESAALVADYMIEKCRLDYYEARLHVLVEDGSSQMLKGLCLEAKTENGEKTKGAIMKMIDAVIKFIENIITKISDKVKAVFGKLSSDKLTADDYLNSETFNLVVNMKYQQELDKIESQLSEGDKLIKKISSTGIADEGTVKGYVNTTRTLIDNLPQIAIKAAVTAATIGGTVILAKNYKNITGGLIKGMDGVKKLFKNVKQTVSNKASNATVSAQKEIVKAMGSLSRKHEDISSKITLSMLSAIHGKQNVQDNLDSIKAAAMAAKSPVRKPAKIRENIIRGARGVRDMF